MRWAYFGSLNIIISFLSQSGEQGRFWVWRGAIQSPHTVKTVTDYGNRIIKYVTMHRKTYKMSFTLFQVWAGIFTLQDVGKGSIWNLQVWSKAWFTCDLSTESFAYDYTYFWITPSFLFHTHGRMVEMKPRKLTPFFLFDSSLFWWGFSFCAELL